jgi:hypothetical protein
MWINAPSLGINELIPDQLFIIPLATQMLL